MTTTTKVVTIKPPHIGRAVFHIVGTAPLVIAKFSAKAKQAMRNKQLAGSSANKGAKRDARDFEEDFRQAHHFSEEGWPGISAAAFRCALISACRLVGFKMTIAKLSVFVEADGLDADEGTPLIRIQSVAEPEMYEAMTRNATGVADIRVRPMWRRWEADLRLSYDEDQFTIDDVTNLLMRAGMQVGVGEGRPDSKSSAGQGWGTFRIES